MLRSAGLPQPYREMNVHSAIVAFRFVLSLFQEWCDKLSAKIAPDWRGHRPGSAAHQPFYGSTAAKNKIMMLTRARRAFTTAPPNIRDTLLAESILAYCEPADDRSVDGRLF